MTKVDVLLPTCNRADSLIMTLGGLAGQARADFRLILADQSEEPVCENAVVQSALRVIAARGGRVETHHRPPVHGIAEQRNFLLGQARARAVLFLDDDVFMEPWVLGRLLEVLDEQGCGFVGAFPAGLSFVDDVRPDQQRAEFWDGPVRPEAVEPGSAEWERWQLHRAANVYHAAQKLASGEQRLYKLAWLSCCILFDREKLLAVGGFSFWDRLPRYHSGEEVLVENLLMRRYGGCGILPSGTYSTQAPTTVLNAAGTVDGHALDLLPEMVRRYAPETARLGT